MNELIKLAKEKGFLLKPGMISCFSGFHIVDCNYLWLCELQKWLREQKFIFVTIRYYLGECIYKVGTSETYKESIHTFNSYEEALEMGLIEALK